MSFPQPKVALNNPCAVIHDKTLYVWTSDAFQSIKLARGTKWETLAQSETVTGGVCVGSTPDDASKAGFWIVGGKGATDEYPGLQKFTYSKKAWETIVPVQQVTKDRLGHGATYMAGSDSILIYAGDQDGSPNPGSATFSIGAAAPFAVSAHPPGPPPSRNPILLPKSTHEALLISPTDAQIMVFEYPAGWRSSGATLQTLVTADQRPFLLTGADGSLHLFRYDGSASPNVVTRTLLIDGAGKPVANAAPVRRWDEEDDGLVPRQNADNWPKYNATSAPAAPRSGYALATNADGTEVAVVGGSADHVVDMFNARSNSWIDTAVMLSDQQVVAQNIAPPSPSSLPSSSVSIPASSDTSSTTSLSSVTRTSTTSSTSAPATTSSTAATAAVDATVPSASSRSPALPTAPAVIGATTSGSKSNLVLGAVLGSICGVILVLLGFYWLLRKKRAARKSHASQDDGSDSIGAPPSYEKSAHGFNEGLSPKGSPQDGRFGLSRGHQTHDSQASFSSMAIMLGRTNQNKPGFFTKRNSADSIFSKAFKSTISKPIPQATVILSEKTRDRAPTPDSDDEENEKGVTSGTGTGTAEAQPQPRDRSRLTHPDPDDATRRSSGWNRYWSGGSTLNILGFGGGASQPGDKNKRLTLESDISAYSEQNHMTGESAALGTSSFVESHNGPALNRVHTASPTVSHYDDKYKDGLSGRIERSTSNASFVSEYSSGIPASVQDAWNLTASMLPLDSARDPSSTFPASVYTTPLLPASARLPTHKFPGVPSEFSAQPQLDRAATSSDMSWLNLGSDRSVGG